MSLFDDVKSYADKAKRGTFGTIGAVGGSLIGLPTASLVGLVELVQGKSRQEALADISETYGSYVNGAEQFGRDHGPAIFDFLWHMMEHIGQEKLREQARARARESGK